MSYTYVRVHTYIHICIIWIWKVAKMITEGTGTTNIVTRNVSPIFHAPFASSFFHISHFFSLFSVFFFIRGMKKNHSSNSIVVLSIARHVPTISCQDAPKFVGRIWANCETPGVLIVRSRLITQRRNTARVSRIWRLLVVITLTREKETKETRRLSFPIINNLQQ